MIGRKMHFWPEILVLLLLFSICELTYLNTSTMIKWSIWTATYNVGMEKVDMTTIQKLLAPLKEKHYDMIVVGMQEVPHLEVLGGFNSTWQSAMAEWMAINVDTVTLVAKTYQATNQIVIFVAKKLLNTIASLDFRYSRSAFGGMTGHKGSIGLKVQLKASAHDSTKTRSLMFVVSHFFHDVLQNNRRLLQFQTNKYCSFPETSSSLGRIWMGDLNFRVDRDVEEARQMLADGKITELLQNGDQLVDARRNGTIFQEYQEAEISFAPTYKFFKGTSNYDPRRTPSWCDRILYEGADLTCKKYGSMSEVLISDHHPVFGEFHLQSPVDLPTCSWEVLFEAMPEWYSTVPLVVRFQYRNNFWNKKGTYRDWIGIYPASLSNVTGPITWTYAATCYDTKIKHVLYSVVELPALPPGQYRVGYFSAKSNFLAGLGKAFTIRDVPPVEEY